MPPLPRPAPQLNPDSAGTNEGVLSSAAASSGRTQAEAIARERAEQTLAQDVGLDEHVDDAVSRQTDLGGIDWKTLELRYIAMPKGSRNISYAFSARANPVRDSPSF